MNMDIHSACLYLKSIANMNRIAGLTDPAIIALTTAMETVCDYVAKSEIEKRDGVIYHPSTAGGEQ